MVVDNEPCEMRLNGCRTWFEWLLDVALDLATRPVALHSFAYIHGITDGICLPHIVDATGSAIPNFVQSPSFPTSHITIKIDGRNNNLSGEADGATSVASIYPEK